MLPWPAEIYPAACGFTITNPLPSVVTLFLQNWIADPSGPQGLTSTNAVSVTTL